ncbi:hypothetical protein DIPPA_25383 [Diplonema papillatum]|nr:hypothetical protein DIPPA_25383 [Diplonema papillatum]
MCGVGGEETVARPGDARSDTEVETQAATIGPQSATREAADAGANTAIENAAEGDDTRTAAGNEAAA